MIIRPPLWTTHRNCMITAEESGAEDDVSGIGVVVRVAGRNGYVS